MKHQLTILLVLLLVFVIAFTVVFSLILLKLSTETEHLTSNEYRGCIASAYQASKNGFDLEENLKVCHEN